MVKQRLDGDDQIRWDGGGRILHPACILHAPPLCTLANTPKKSGEQVLNSTVTCENRIDSSTAAIRGVLQPENKRHLPTHSTHVHFGLDPIHYLHFF